ncbi:MAG: hypothetical protein Q7R92_03490 [bacterium]|nr:hypothetical protein [bacterium]
MTIKNMFQVKVSLPAALLIIVTAVLLSEQIFLKEIKKDNGLINSLSIANSLLDRQSSDVWQNGKVSLANINVPLMSGAKRLSFDSKYLVRYRVNAKAGAVARFYRQILANQGWKTSSAAVSAKAVSDKLVISYQENPFSKKTDITYAYVPVSTAKVLGVKIAEADVPAPAPSPAPESTPAPAPTEPQPSTPPPADNNTSAPISGDQNQPSQPQPPMPPTNSDKFQPPMPQQPQNQDGMNQMQFYKQPMQPSSGDQGASQTCRINGVEVPGSCEKYNNQGPSGQDGQMGQGRQQGPSEEDQKKMDERRFKDMKRGISQFSRGVAMTKKAMLRVKASVAKCGVGLPEELTSALNQADDLVTKINAAKTADELDEVMGDVQDVGSVIQDWGPRMGDLSRLCQMLKEADRQSKSLDRGVKQIESRAKANKKVDLSEQVAEYKNVVNGLKDALAQAKSLAKTDPDSAMEKLEEDFWNNMDNLKNAQMQIDVVLNISQGMKNINSELKKYASQIKLLAKKKIDIAELQDLVNNLKAKFDEIQTMLKEKAGADELADKIDEAFNTRQEIQDALQEFGLVNMEPQIKANNNYNVKVDLPDAFLKQGGNQEE